MTAADPWGWWKRALAGQKQPVTMGEPQWGYFRHIRKDKATKAVVEDLPVAVWQEDGEWIARRGADTFRGQERVYEVFEWACKKPVTHSAWKARVEKGVWPDAIEAPAPAPPAAAAEPETAAEPERGIGDNSGNRTPLEEKRDEIETVWTAYDTWFKTIGQEITTKDQAEKAAVFADRFTKLESEADKLRDAEKRPHLEAGRKVDANWKPLTQRAEAGKKAVKGRLGAYFDAERRRQQEEERKAREARLKEIAEQPFAAPSAPSPVFDAPAPIRAGGGSGRTIAAVTVKRVEILDIEAVKAAFIQTAAGEQAAREWCARVGPTAPVLIPGTRQFDETVAR